MFITKKMPKSLSAEAYRSLRTSIKFSSVDRPIKTLVVTSSIMGEGKSTVAGNIANILSQDGARVLMIDCDLRKPSVHYNFFITNGEGLTDVLVGNSDLKSVIKKVDDSLFLITAGTVPPNPSEMLASRAMTAFIKEMKEEFKYIILDTPPLQAVTDAQVLSTKADGILLVVKAGSTKKDAVLNSVDLIEKVHGKVIGIVLNGVLNKKNNYYYYGE